MECSRIVFDQHFSESVWLDKAPGAGAKDQSWEFLQQEQGGDNSGAWIVVPGSATKAN